MKTCPLFAREELLLPEGLNSLDRLSCRTQTDTPLRAFEAARVYSRKLIQPIVLEVHSFRIVTPLCKTPETT